MLTVTYPTLLVFLLSTGLTMADMQYQESTTSWPQGFSNLKAVNMLLRVVTENSWFCCDSGVGQVWGRCGAVGQVWSRCGAGVGRLSDRQRLGLSWWVRHKPAGDWPGHCQIITSQSVPMVTLGGCALPMLGRNTRCRQPSLPSSETGVTVNRCVH